MRWAYGVTTVPSRRQDLLPRTLASLCSAGFDSPRLFVDGLENCLADRWQQDLQLTVTARFPFIRVFGNWVLGLAELYIRDPGADRYAMFQDDFVTYPNMRQYLERCAYPDGEEGRDKGYWNLYTFPSNQNLAPVDGKGMQREGWYPSNQFGRGAVALVFNRPAVITLLTHLHMVERPQDCTRGWRAVDGGIVTAMGKAGWKEYVHNPSLVQHTGLVSSMGNKPHKLAVSFRGEDYDALRLLEGK